MTLGRAMMWPERKLIFLRIPLLNRAVHFAFRGEGDRIPHYTEVKVAGMNHKGSFPSTSGSNHACIYEDSY